MADHDPELWHAIGRLAMVVENLNNKPVYLGPLFGGGPSDNFSAGKSQTFRAISDSLKAAETEKGKASKLLKDIEKRITANQKNMSTATLDTMKKSLGDEKVLLDAAKKAVEDFVHGFEPYIKTLTTMKTALTAANVSNGLLKSADESLKKAEDALKKAQDVKLEKTRNDESEIKKCNDAAEEVQKAEGVISKIRESTNSTLKSAGLSL